MKRHDGICSLQRCSSSCAIRTLFMIYAIGLIISDNSVTSYPSWDAQTTITDFGRNIRQLPCVSRRTGDTGICMFAYSCAKANGTHLGTCIDRFYFGSCCKVPGGDTDFEVNEPDNYLNNLDNDVVGPPITTNNKISSQPTSTDRYITQTNSPTTLTSFPSSTLLTYKPTTKFAVPSTTPSTTSTSRTQYTEISTSNGTRPTFTSSSLNSISSTYSTTIAQSTKPVASTFSTVKPLVKPSSFKPPIKDPVVTTVQKPKPQTAKPTVQFTLPSSTVSNSPYSSSQETTKPQTATSSFTTMSSLRPLNTTVSATFATTKPVVKPSSTTYKATTTPASTTTFPQKIKPQTPKPTVKPKPSSVKTDSTTTFESVTSPYITRLPIENATETMIISTAPTTTQNNQNQTLSYSSSTITSTSPTLVTWTTLDKVPVIPSENTKPPQSITYKPSSVDVSTLPSWVKLPVETHEPNTSGAPINESSTNEYISTSMTSKPTTIPSPSDNDIIMTSNSVYTNNSSTQSPPSPSLSPPLSTSAMLVQTTTDSNEAGNVPLNMSNYKDVCGRRLFPTARIVGGEKVSFGKWPWQISLRQWRTSTYLHKCGAALFNENWAVTAAHCVENVPPSDLLLRLGEHDLSVEEEPYGYEERRIQIVASHPQFDPRTFEYDLALLRFYEPVKFQPNIIPVCVPEEDLNFVGSSAYVTGWGRLYEDGPLPSVLQEVTVPVINNSVCETMYRAAGYIEHIPDIFICAGWKKGGFDSCEGDSGGPMVIQRPDKRWLLAGIISWGIGCAEPNQPGVYTRISKFKEWINQILQF